MISVLERGARFHHVDPQEYDEYMGEWRVFVWQKLFGHAPSGLAEMHNEADAAFDRAIAGGNKREILTTAHNVMITNNYLAADRQDPDLPENFLREDSLIRVK